MYPEAARNGIIMFAAMDGFRIIPGCLDEAAQRAVLADLDQALRIAPLTTPVMPRTGRPFSVRMSNFGRLGWVSDRSGYRYQPLHPETEEPWPPIPASILAVWRRVAHYPHDPEACLVNHYRPGARMGLHRDEDEEAFEAPVVSISLGDTAVFRIGGAKRADPTRTVRLASGDVAVLGGQARLAYHGIDRIVAGTSRLLPQGGRINLTLRRVSPPC